MSTESRSLNFAYFLLGIAVPMGIFLVWSKTDGFGLSLTGRKRKDVAHDITVEDSFPASDPPSAW